MTFPAGIVDALDPQRLRLLVELKHRGSISAAADACRMGQPSATKHLKTLEAALGEKLVERDGRASRLTEAGEIVAAHAQRVLDTLDGMQEELRALRGAEIGTLTLAASTTPGSYVLPSILECFAERHPRVDVDVVIGSSRWVAERVARRDVSLGLAGELDWPDGRDRRAVPRRRGRRHRRARAAAARRARATLDDFAAQTLLVREPGSSTRAVAERHLARAGYRPAKRWELDSNEAIKRSVRAGLGIGFVSRLVVAGRDRPRRARGVRDRRRRADAALRLPAAPRRARAGAGRARVHRDALLLLRDQRRRLHGGARRRLTRLFRSGNRRIAHLLWVHARRRRTVRPCTSASCSTTRPRARRTCSAASRKAGSPWWTRTSTSSTTTSRWPTRRAIPIVAVFETHVQADHVSGCPSWSRAPARLRTCPRAPA